MNEKAYIELLKLVADTAQMHGLNPDIVYGVCMQESQMNPYAARFESGYKWLYRPRVVKPKICSIQTERALQKTSLGLMQVMGAVYREYQYHGWLTEIFSRPDLQLEYGCRHLAKKIKKFGARKGILAYNSGSPRMDNKTGDYINAYYYDGVMKYATLEADRLKVLTA